jgi:hypothetical protein
MEGEFEFELNLNQVPFPNVNCRLQINGYSGNYWCYSFKRLSLVIPIRKTQMARCQPI